MSGYEGERWWPKHPHLASWGGRATVAVVDRYLSLHGLHRPDSRTAKVYLAALEQRMSAGREAYVLGFNTASHNSGAALVRVANGRVEMICNEEEERYTGTKHCSDYPEHSIEAVKRQMQTLGLNPRDLVACVSCWDYAAIANAVVVQPALEEAPASLALLWGKAEGTKATDARGRVTTLVDAPARLGRQLGLVRRLPIVGVRHHESHAYFSHAVSPFADEPDVTMVLVIDSGGDGACTSLYSCRAGRLTLLSAYATNQLGSLGWMYAMLSATQGGWPALSSEGRYMGAAAWGDNDRLTNRYYRRLKHLFHFGAAGEISLNRSLASWVRYSWGRPYSEELVEILGEPIALEDMWNPDAVLNVEDIQHPEITRDRVDKAAAVQMVFEDALVHIVDHLIRTTRSHRLVLTGGTALNCVANMRLLECFDESWYERNLGIKGARLHLWVPPVPGDAGAPVGAAYAFAMHAGARPGPPLKHAFYCGVAPGTAATRAAVEVEPSAADMCLGNVAKPDVMEMVADLLAYAVTSGCIMGLWQGASETGPRALGHRSILANPCDADTRRLLNERVKHRELIRPLAPMLTREAAERFFCLENGASDDDYNAYNYMILTARARPDAYAQIPSVIHHDGTGRLQIVRPDVDPFCHTFLRAMGRRAGAEVSVNTSLNVGAPISHSPSQVIATLKRAHGMDGLVMIDGERQATLVWLEDRVKERERLMGCLREWTEETGFALPSREMD